MHEFFEVTACALLIATTACGVEPSWASIELETQLKPPKVEDPSGPEPADPTPPLVLGPSESDVLVASRTCTRGMAALNEGRLEAAAGHFDLSLPILRHTTDANGRRTLRSCLGGAGRLSEALLDLSGARDLYREQLRVEAGPSVERRLRSLGERDELVPQPQIEMITRQLAPAEGHPCGASAAECEVRVHLARTSGGGRLLRAAVVSVRRPESEEHEGMGSYYLVWTGPGGAHRWGPRLGPAIRDEGTHYDDPNLTMGFRPASATGPWVLFIRADATWSERCCGGGADGHDRDLTICELTDTEARCVRVAKQRQCEGYSDEPDDSDDQPCDEDTNRFVSINGGGITVRGDHGPLESARSADGTLEGFHAWRSVFPRRDL